MPLFPSRLLVSLLVFLAIFSASSVASFLIPVSLILHSSSRGATARTKRTPRVLLLHSSSSENTNNDDDNEETLLRLHLQVNEGIQYDTAYNTIINYTQSFPFSAILPVQPLQYLPTHDGGVDVVFLRKKTQEKGSVDGGIRFYVVNVNTTTTTSSGIELYAKRNSQGQVVSKHFSEGQIIQRFVKGITGEEPIVGSQVVHPLEVVRVTSVFHKWM